MTTQNKETGAKGEQLALEYLKKKGYVILETNKRFSRFCEIDIIALDKDCLVFCDFDGILGLSPIPWFCECFPEFRYQTQQIYPGH